jgi:hypothetical protein
LAQKLMAAIAALPVKVDTAGRVTDSWQFPTLPAAPADLPAAAPADAPADAPAAAAAAAADAGAAAAGGGACDAAASVGEAVGGGGAGDRKAMHAVVRSKGFVWLANCHQVR